MRPGIGLFRAKDTNGKWHEGYIDGRPKHTNSKGIFFKMYVTIELSKGFRYEEYLVLPATICEYTGLKDSYGTKIFENDIISWIADGKNTPQTDVIKYHARKWSYPGFDLSTFHYDSNGLQYIVLDGKDVKVIGNSFDNPELLEKSEVPNELKEDS